ncbi:uncharacterized protein O3C94_000271 [Discoglossus pictus]
MKFFHLHLGSFSLCIYLLAGVQAETFMIKNVQLERCIHMAQDSGRVSMAQCKLYSQHQQWIWDPDTRAIMDMKSRRCLTVHKIQEFSSVRMEPCENNEHQAWTCDKRGHLILQHHGLHLSTKLGTKKVFVSKGTDKFSKWKTIMDEPICTGGVSPTKNPEKEAVEEVTQVLYESTFPSTTQQNVISSIAVTGPGSCHTQIPDQKITSITKDATQYITEDTDTGEPEQQFVSAQQNVVEKQYVPVQEPMGWKMAMLILSPVAIVLGGIILILNIQHNKKRKLSALPSYPKSIHKLGSSYEQSPLTGQQDGGQYPGQDPHSPTLRHGEILIEWKDGTVTPLFDQQAN